MAVEANTGNPAHGNEDGAVQETFTACPSVQLAGKGQVTSAFDSCVQRGSLTADATDRAAATTTPTIR